MNSTAKIAIRRLFLLLMLPWYWVFLLLANLGNEDACFHSFSQALSLIPGRIGRYMRAAFYRLACPGTSDDIVIGFLTLLSHRDTTIERGVYIGPQCNIGRCTIGEDTLLGSGVHVLSGKHQHGFADPNQPIKTQPGAFQKIRVGRDCWLGNASIIMAPIADQCIVGAGTVVTQPTESGWICAGNPATHIADRQRAEAL